MALPAPRDLPIVEARYDPLRRAWLVTLPGNLTLPARGTAEAEELVARYAPSSAIRWVRERTTDTAGGR